MLVCQRVKLVAFSALLLANASCHKKNEEITSNNVEKTIENGLQKAQEKVDEKSEEFKEEVTQLTEAADDKASEMKEAVVSKSDETVKEATDAVENFTDKASTTVSKATENAAESVTKAAGTALQKAETLKKKVLETPVKKKNQDTKKLSQSKPMEKHYSTFLQCRVKASNLNVRLKPSATAKVIAKLPGGKVVRAKKANANWMQVSLQNGSKGFSRKGNSLLTCESTNFASRRNKNRN